MFAIFKKELRAYFISPVGYVYTGIFLAAAALICAFTTIQQASYNTTSYFQYMIFTFIILIPLLTMRLFSEERKMRTEQLLLTAPVSITGMVLGKYLAAVSILAVSLLCSMIFPLAMAIFGNPAWGEILTSYLGCLLLGSALIALGLFLSSLTDSQAIAAITTLVVVLLLYVANMIGPYLNVAWLTTIISWFSIFSRYDYFYAGLIDLPAIIYFVSFSAVFVFLTIRTVEKRRWSEG